MGETDGMRLQHAAEVFCAAVPPSSRDELEKQLLTTRRIVNILELGFARTASKLAALPVADVGRDENPVEFLRDECRMTSHAARTAVTVGNLEAQLPGSIEALVDGSIGMSHLGWMADTAHRLALSTSATAGFDEDHLLGKAKHLSVQRFRRECEQVIHAADHAAFVADQVAGVDARRMKLTTFDDGAVHLDAFLDPEGGAIVRTAIEPFARREGSDDHRGVAQRRADALVEVCNHILDTGQVPQQGGQRPHLHVTTTLETLLDHCGAPAAVAESGALLSGTTVERLGCDGTLVRVLLDPKSMVIDVGRATRVVPAATRRALNVRDQGCVWPGCSRGVSWTQAHHLIFWSVGGRTDMNNIVLLCFRHHWQVHEGGWVIARADDGQILTFAPAFDQFPQGRDPTIYAA